MKKILLFIFLQLVVALNAQTFFLADDKIPYHELHGSRITMFEPTVQDGKQIVYCKQEPNGGRYLEFMIANSKAKSRLTGAITGVLEVELFMPEDANIRSFSLRLRDGRGEVFQHSFFKAPLKPGWHTLKFPVDFRKENKESWGRAQAINHTYEQPIAFSGVASGPIDLKKPRRFGLRRISFIPQITLPFFDLDTNCPVHVLRPEDDDKLALTIQCNGSEPFNLKGSYAVTDAWNNTLATAPLDMKVVNGKPHRIKLDAPDAFGTFYVTISYTFDGKPVTRRLSFCRMIPAGPTPGKSVGFIFGVQSHALRYTPAEQELDALAAGLMGAKVYRTSGNWSLAQKSPDQAPDFTLIDDMMKRYEKQGLEPQIGFLNTPKWAIDKNWKPFFPDYKNTRGNRGCPAPDLGHYAKYVEAFMTYFRGRVRFVESWNEPDLISFANFSADTYVDIMKTFYKAVKKAAPEATVLTGGYTAIKLPYPGRSTHPDHMAYTMEKAKGYYDVHAFHAHGAHSSYYRQIVQLHEMQRRIGVNVPWYANETAESSVRRGETIQASTLFKKFLYTWALYGIGYNWYDLRNDGYDPNDSEHHFGLITRDFYPKAAYSTYNTLARYFTQATFLKPYTTAEGFQAYLFKAKNGDYLIPCWHIRENMPSRLLVLSNIKGKVAVVDIFGNEKPVVSNEGIAFIDSTSWPVAIKVSGQAEFPNLDMDIISVPGHFAVHPQKNNTLQLSIRNPLDQELTLSMTLTPSSGITLDKTQAELTLKPRETRIETLAIKATGKQNIANPSLKLEFTFGKILKNTHHIKLKQINILPTDFTIEGIEHVRVLVVNAPEYSHLVWKNNQDLSAKLNVSTDKKNLILNLLVNDDTHLQPFTGFNVWKGDNVQVALALPGQDTSWEFGMTHFPENKSCTYVYKTPKKLNGKDIDVKAKVAISRSIKVVTKRDDAKKTTSYNITIPFETIGMTEEIGKKGFQLNLIVNDCDEESRESYLFLTPGLGGGMHMLEAFHYFSFE